MLHKKSRHRRLAELLVILVFLGMVFVLALVRTSTVKPNHQDVEFGITFSSKYAQQLGLDWRRTYVDLLDQLGVKKVRLPLYWDAIQPGGAGMYEWNDADWMIEEAEKRGVQLTVAVGRKVPRWPECFIPGWVNALTVEDQKQALLDYVGQVVERYDDSVAVERWQVENEPFFPFGTCPLPDGPLFQQEVSLVRGLSRKPIQLTTSGESEFWGNVAVQADVVGVSLYQITWSDVVGFTVYPLGPEFYAAKAAITKPFTDKIVVSELQAEPWFNKPYNHMTLAEANAAFTPDELQHHVDIATAAGFDEVYLWGAEWWYYLHAQGQGQLWKKAQALFLP